MSDVNIQLVREFFELRRFHVMTHWPGELLREGPGDHAFQLFVENTRPGPPRELDFVLHPSDLSGVHRAAVEVRAWHTDRFYPSLIESSRALSEPIGEESRALAADVFGGREFTTILVVSELPATRELRERSMQLLSDTGTQHVIEFPALLLDLLDRVSVLRAYPGSQTLQTLWILKRYRLIRNQQLEFMFATESPTVERVTTVETARNLDEEPDQN